MVVPRCFVICAPPHLGFNLRLFVVRQAFSSQRQNESLRWLPGHEPACYQAHHISEPYLAPARLSVALMFALLLLGSARREHSSAAHQRNEHSVWEDNKVPLHFHQCCRGVTAAFHLNPGCAQGI